MPFMAHSGTFCWPHDLGVQWTDTGIATLPLLSRGAAPRCTPPTAQEITPLLFMDYLNRSKNNNMTQIHLPTFVFPACVKTKPGGCMTTFL